MVDINKYNRNDVYIEEFNNSEIEQQPVQESIINFVLGFSKKGKFNAPALIRTKKDRESIYGNIDRTLEKNDSWFHRTIDTLLASGPVWGLSLLKTTDDDKLNYVSVSLAPQMDNGVSSTAKYSDFFNKSGFWYADTESFINTANDADKIFHITNMSDKKISVFMFKSPLTGYDVTLENWYGDATKVPSYLYKNDLVSDYLVRVIVLSGDWSNYKLLSNDTIFSKYFNADGLNKTKVDSFLNEKTVNVLAKWDVSLIPYFRDENNQNIFIESVINKDKDKTGLFCAFNIEKFESEYPNGLVDLKGHTLLYLENKLTNPSFKENINFMSYKDSIIETVTYNETVLDRLTNVVALGAPISAGVGEMSRTGINTNGYIHNITANYTNLNISTIATPTLTLVVGTGGGYIVHNNKKVNFSQGNIDIQISGISPSGVAGEYNYLKTAIVCHEGGINAYPSDILVTNTQESLASAKALTYTWSSIWNDNDHVLGYVISLYDESRSEFKHEYVPIGLNNFGYIYPYSQLVSVVKSNTATGSTATLTFTNVPNPVKTDFINWRCKQYFDAFLSLKGDSRSVVVFNNGIKVPSTAFTWVDSSLLSSQNKYITLTLNTTAYGSLTTMNSIMIYGIDDEFYVGTTGIASTVSKSATNGIASKYSKFYLDFYNGTINSTNYFYLKTKNTPVRFVKHTDGFSYVIIPTANVSPLYTSGFKMWIPAHTGNSGLFTLNGNGTTSISGLALASETAYKVEQNVVTASAETVDIYSFNDKVYLRIYTVNDVLNCKFYADKNFTSPYTIPAGYESLNVNLNVYSEGVNYEQTLEIESVIGDNTILVSSARYPEIVIGDYLEAYVDYSTLEAGEIPNSFTRIISKKKYSDTLLQIVTDSKIAISNYNGDYQTRRYTNIANYVSTYKTITLDPFIIRQASLPNGTEARQSELLDLVAVDTPLFNAITNRNRFSYRYLVDSLGLGLTENSKQQLVDICGKRVATIGFINMPSIKAFKKSSSPSFKDVDNNLVVSHIRTGGDLDSNPSFLYSFGKGIGATSSAYFTPYVTVNDNGRPLLMPPAAFAANTYMAKNNSNLSGKYPYTIAAGIEDGRINNIADVEYPFNDAELEELFKMRANVITYDRNNVFYLDNEFTADSAVKSSLSYLHSREVLIEIENELYALLLPYKHKFNTAGIRAEIKRKADILLGKYRDRGALYDFYTIIDATNNTTQIIDNSIGLLQVYVEIVRGMGIVIAQISVEKTGAISLMGFTPNNE